MAQAYVLFTTPDKEGGVVADRDLLKHSEIECKLVGAGGYDDVLVQEQRRNAYEWLLQHYLFMGKFTWDLLKGNDIVPEKVMSKKSTNSNVIRIEFKARPDGELLTQDLTSGGVLDLKRDKEMEALGRAGRPRSRDRGHPVRRILSDPTPILQYSVNGYDCQEAILDSVCAGRAEIAEISTRPAQDVDGKRSHSRSSLSESSRRSIGNSPICENSKGKALVDSPC